MEQPEPKTRLVPTGTLASQLGLHPRELRAEADAGTLPHVRVGKCGLLFDPEKVIASLQQRSKNAAAATGRELDAAP